MPDGERALRRDRNFLLFVALQAISFAGDALTTVALPLLVFQATGSLLKMGLLTGTVGAVWLVAGVLAGSIVDRFDRRTLMIVCDVARALLYAAVPLVWVLDAQLWVLFVVMPLGAAAGMLYQVTYVTAIPALVGRDRVTQANGTLSATYAAASVGGMALAGVLAAAFGPAAAIGIDAASFAVAAVATAFLRLGPRAVVPAARTSSLRGFAEGVRFLWGHRALRSLTLLLAGVLFLTYGIDDLFVYHLKAGLERGDDTVGLVLALGAVGSIVAGSTVAVLRRRLGFGACWIGAYVLTALAVVAAGVSTSLAVVALGVAVVLFCQGVAGTCSMSLRQEVTPEHLLGRVTSAFWTLHFLPGPVGALLVTAAGQRYGVPAVALAVAIGLLLIAGAAALTPIRARDPGLVPA